MAWLCLKSIEGNLRLTRAVSLVAFIVFLFSSPVFSGGGRLEQSRLSGQVTGRPRLSVELPRKKADSRYKVVVPYTFLFPFLRGTASGDLNGDGIEELVTIREEKAGERISVFSLKGGAVKMTYESPPLHIPPPFPLAIVQGNGRKGSIWTQVRDGNLLEVRESPTGWKLREVSFHDPVIALTALQGTGLLAGIMNSSLVLLSPEGEKVTTTRILEERLEAPFFRLVSGQRNSPGWPDLLVQYFSFSLQDSFLIRLRRTATGWRKEEIFLTHLREGAVVPIACLQASEAPETRGASGEMLLLASVWRQTPSQGLRLDQRFFLLKDGSLSDAGGGDLPFRSSEVVHSGRFVGRDPSGTELMALSYPHKEYPLPVGIFAFRVSTLRSHPQGLATLSVKSNLSLPLQATFQSASRRRSPESWEAHVRRTGHKGVSGEGSAAEFSHSRPAISDRNPNHTVWACEASPEDYVMGRVKGTSFPYIPFLEDQREPVCQRCHKLRQGDIPRWSMYNAITKKNTFTPDGVPAPEF